MGWLFVRLWLVVVCGDCLLWVFKVGKEPVSHPLGVLDQARSRRRVSGLWVELRVVDGERVAAEKLVSNSAVCVGAPDEGHDHGEEGGVGGAGAGAEEKVLGQMDGWVD